MGQRVGAWAEQVKPEALYFGEMEGMRTMIAVVDLPEASQMVPVIEPLWLMFEGSIEVHPVMVVEDLVAGLGALQAAGG